MRGSFPFSLTNNPRKNETATKLRQGTKPAQGKGRGATMKHKDGSAFCFVFCSLVLTRSFSHRHTTTDTQRRRRAVREWEAYIQSPATARRSNLGKESIYIPWRSCASPKHRTHHLGPSEKPRPPSAHDPAPSQLAPSAPENKRPASRPLPVSPQPEPGPQQCPFTIFRKQERLCVSYEILSRYEEVAITVIDPM